MDNLAGTKTNNNLGKSVISLLIGLLVVILILVAGYYLYLCFWVKEPQQEEEESSGLPKRHEAHEVFNVSNNLYGYHDARAVCKAFGAELATYDQVKDTHQRGGEWCNYGWSEGQLALYPTQHSTWEKLQTAGESHRNDCGKPGINGGYFENPNLRFGVNCYGKKPEPRAGERDLTKDTVIPDYLTQEDIVYKNKIDLYTREKQDITLLPFDAHQWFEP